MSGYPVYGRRAATPLGGAITLHLGLTRAPNVFKAFSRTTTIVETAGDLTTAGTGYRKVTVTVTNPDAHLGTTSISIASVLTDYDQ